MSEEKNEVSFIELRALCDLWLRVDGKRKEEVAKILADKYGLELKANGFDSERNGNFFEFWLTKPIKIDEVDIDTLDPEKLKAKFSQPTPKPTED